VLVVPEDLEATLARLRALAEAPPVAPPLDDEAVDAPIDRASLAREATTAGVLVTDIAALGQVDLRDSVGLITSPPSGGS
jgi:hypothetical protein